MFLETHLVWIVLRELRPEGNIRSLLQKMQLTQSRKLRQNAALKIPKILAQRDKAAKYKEEENPKKERAEGDTGRWENIKC